MNKALRLLIPLLTALLALSAFLSVIEASAHARTTSPQTAILVNTLADELNTDGDCALREAIQAANTNAAVDACPAGMVLTDTITFSVAGTVTVGSQLDLLASGGPLVINGGEKIAVSGGGNTRVFFVDGAIDLRLEGLTVANGRTPQNTTGAGLYNGGGNLTIRQCAFIRNGVIAFYFPYGGAIYSEGGSLTILDSRFEGNTATGYSAGVAVHESVTIIQRSTFLNNRITVNMGSGAVFLSTAPSFIIQDSIFISNTATEGGGAIYSDGPMTLINNTFIGNNTDGYCKGQASCGGAIRNQGTMTIDNNVFSGNYTLYNGAGGVANSGSLTILNTTFSNNTSPNNGAGGAVYHSGGLLNIANSTFWDNHSISGGAVNNHLAALAVLNSTFSGNSATYGGGINNQDGTVTIVNTTIFSNSATTGSGINHTGGSMVLTNTIVAANSPSSDCAGNLTDGGYNLSSDTSCGFAPANHSLPGIDPLLEPLHDNGGPTWTHALPLNSPAVEAGDNAACPPTDQRGVPRPLDSDQDGEVTCDMGAYEFPAGVYLYPRTQSGSGVPGVVTEYSLKFYNWSPLTDTYALALGPSAWHSELSALQLGPLAPDDAATFTVSVFIPLHAPWYLTDTVNITVTSLTNPALYQASAQAGTNIFSIGPSELRISGPETGLAGNPYTFTAVISPSSATLPITYTWLSEGQQTVTHTAGLSDTAFFTWGTPGVYTLTINAVNYRAAISNSLIVAISDIPIYGYHIQGDSPIQVGVPAHFTATVIQGTNVIYTWDFGDGATGSGSTVTHTYTTAGWRWLSGQAQNSVNLTGYGFNQYVADVPITGLQASNDSPTLIGQTTTFSATLAGGTGVTYSWDFGDGTSASGITVTHTYAHPSIYDATLTATNSAGTQKDITSVTVFAYYAHLPIIFRNINRYGDITGSVYDAATHTGIGGATVCILPAGPCATTDSAGFYVFNTVPIGEQTLRASAGGYYDKEETILLDNNDFNLDFDLVSTVQYGSVTGQVTSAVTGMGIGGASVCHAGGSPCTTTDGAGNYTLSGLLPGSQTLRASAEGYFSLDQTVIIVINQASSLNYILSPTLAQGEMRIVLTWGANPRDIDSHLWLPPSHPYHIYFSNKGNCSASPYACLDIDDQYSYGPETITIKERFEGNYRYAVYKYAGDGLITNSGAHVQVYDSTGLIANYYVPTSGTGDWWYVFDLDGSTGVITVHDTIQEANPKPY
ncbi:MAG TPA: PKD domain-containing protein [Anaerolineales bacterium]|nr:PKD domain-containing protein [Anaerolineales bacterium]